MLAICFKCGGNKTGALILCKECQALPKTDEEKVLSMCLSLQCVTDRTLNNCRIYFKTKKKAPRFKEPIVQKAVEFLEEQAVNSKNDQSIQFSSSTFDFPDIVDQPEPAFMKTITAHIIGKGAKQDSGDANATLGKTKKTYHKTIWRVGTDIDEEQYLANKDPNGEIYIWYRWLNNEWAWQCVSQSRFDQMKMLESGRMG